MASQSHICAVFIHHGMPTYKYTGASMYELFADSQLLYKKERIQKDSFFLYASFEKPFHLLYGLRIYDNAAKKLQSTRAEADRISNRGGGNVS